MSTKKWSTSRQLLLKPQRLGAHLISKNSLRQETPVRWMHAKGVTVLMRLQKMYCHENTGIQTFCENIDEWKGILTSGTRIQLSGLTPKKIYGHSFLVTQLQLYQCNVRDLHHIIEEA